MKHYRAFLLHMFVTKLSAAGQFYSAMRHRTQWIGAPLHVGGRSRIRIWPGSLKAAVKRLQSAFSRSYSRVVSYPLVGCVYPDQTVHYGLWSIALLMPRRSHPDGGGASYKRWVLLPWGQAPSLWTKAHIDCLAWTHRRFMCVSDRSDNFHKIIQPNEFMQ